MCCSLISLKTGFFWEKRRVQSALKDWWKEIHDMLDMLDASKKAKFWRAPGGEGEGRGRERVLQAPRQLGNHTLGLAKESFRER